MKKMMFLAICLLISFLAMNCQKEVITPDNGEIIGKPDTTKKKPVFDLTIKNFEVSFIEKANVTNYELNVGFNMDVYWINNTDKEVLEPIFEYWPGDSTYRRVVFPDNIRLKLGAKQSGQFGFSCNNFYKTHGTYHVKVKAIAYLSANDSITASIEKDFVLKL